MAVNARLFIMQTFALTKKSLITTVVSYWSTALHALILPSPFLALFDNIKNLIIGMDGYGYIHNLKLGAPRNN